MEEYLIIRVYDSKKVKTYDYRKSFRKNGFEFIKKKYGKGYWEKKISVAFSEEIDKTKKYFKTLGFEVFLLSKSDFRSSNYRENFFKENKGVNGIYICAYCGLPFSKERVTVDHIFPVAKTYKSKWLKWFSKMLRIENINDIRNLAPACRKCNSKKGSKAGFWIIRGFLGKHIWFWCICYICIISIIIIFIFFIVR